MTSPESPPIISLIGQNQIAADDITHGEVKEAAGPRRIPCRDAYAAGDAQRPGTRARARVCVCVRVHCACGYSLRVRVASESCRRAAPVGAGGRPAGGGACQTALRRPGRQVRWRRSAAWGVWGGAEGERELLENKIGQRVHLCARVQTCVRAEREGYRGGGAVCVCVCVCVEEVPSLRGVGVRVTLSMQKERGRERARGRGRGRW
jgi:hypothetical protein